MIKEPKRFYAVTFLYGGKRMFAVRGNKPRGIYPPEPRCLFRDKRIADNLKKFLDSESTFHDVRVESRDVG